MPDAQHEPITIRPATPDDALCLGVLGLQVFLDTYATEGIRAPVAREVLASYSTEQCLAHLLDANTLILVAERGPCLLGFAQLSLRLPQPLAPAGVQSELFRLYVQEPFTGSGLGTRLLHAAEQAAAQQGATVLWLTLWVHNHRALGFYAALGYEDFGQTWFCFEGEQHENRLLARRLAAMSDTATRSTAPTPRAASA